MRAVPACSSRAGGGRQVPSGDRVLHRVQHSARPDHCRHVPHRRCHIGTGTGLTPPTSAPGRGSPTLPHLHRDRARPIAHLHEERAQTLPHSAARGLGSPLPVASAASRTDRCRHMELGRLLPTAPDVLPGASLPRPTIYRYSYVSIRLCIYIYIHLYIYVYIFCQQLPTFYQARLSLGQLYIDIAMYLYVYISISIYISIYICIYILPTASDVLPGVSLPVSANAVAHTPLTHSCYARVANARVTGLQRAQVGGGVGRNPPSGNTRHGTSRVPCTVTELAS
jgi:hypothetical protein